MWTFPLIESYMKLLSSTRSPCTIAPNLRGSRASKSFLKSKRPRRSLKPLQQTGLDLREEGDRERELTSSRICSGARSCGRRRGCRSSTPRCRRRRHHPHPRAPPPPPRRHRRRPPRPAAGARRRRAPATRSAPLSAGPTSRASPPIL